MKKLFFKNPESLSSAAAEAISRTVHQTVAETGMFSVALSGGTSPRLLYKTLSKPPYRETMPWEDIHFFFGDERMVPHTDPLSNFYTAHRDLFFPLSIPGGNIHRIMTENNTPEQAANKYEHALKTFFSFQAQALPVFDLILLGVGLDGHTASLFPGNTALEETRKLAIDVAPPEISPAVSRITLTLPVINAAENVFFLVPGRKKMNIVDQIFMEYKSETVQTLPAAMVRAKENLVWFIGEK